MGAVIIGSGMAVPDHVVTNHDLAAVMDTSDEWIRERTGVVERHYVSPGTGSSALAALAVEAALDDADLAPDQVDLLVNATMTPDMFAPGNAPLVADRVGLAHVGAYEIRQQCAGFLYGLELASAFLETRRCTTAVVVGAEAHAGYLPFGPSIWGRLRGTGTEPVSDAEYEFATERRSWAVLFGDGAGAVILRRGRDDEGFVAGRMYSDGAAYDLIHVPGIGFTRQPYIDIMQVEAGMCEPHMNGLELFRRAVRAMPDAVATATEAAGAHLSDLAMVIAHQANARIVDAVAKQLGAGPEMVPQNIDRYGNTTAATLPILFHEQRAADAVRPGSLIAFCAFGAGAHWGANVYRVPA